MTLGQLKKAATSEVREWLRGLPSDGDYTAPELITDKWGGTDGGTGDGDYALIVLFHNNAEAEKFKREKKEEFSWI